MVLTGPHDNKDIKEKIFERTIKGDSNLPEYYNFREAHPECKSTVLD